MPVAWGCTNVINTGCTYWNGKFLVSCLNNQSKEEREKEWWSDLLEVTPQVSSRWDSTVPICRTHIQRSCSWIVGGGVDPLSPEHIIWYYIILSVYLFHTIVPCFVSDKETTCDQQKEQLELCKADVNEDSTILRPRNLAFCRAWVPSFSVCFTRELVLLRTVSCPDWVTLSGSAVRCDSEVLTRNFIHRKDTRFLVRWVTSGKVWELSRKRRKAEYKGTENRETQEHRENLGDGWQWSQESCCPCIRSQQSSRQI